MEGFSGSTSFKDVFLGKPIALREEKIIQVPDDFKAYDHVLGKTVIVRMVAFSALKNVGETTRMLTGGGGVVQYMGGLLAIISFPCREEAERFCSIGKAKKDVFQMVEMWNGQSFPSNELHGSISKVILSWKGRKYQIWGAEEVGEWESDFLVKPRLDIPVVDRSESSSDSICPTNSNGETYVETHKNVEEISDEPVNVVNEDIDNINYEEASKNNCDSQQLPSEVGEETKRGLFKEIFLSLDSRPSSNKRARLDFDPNGLDPFGLDCLLGLNQFAPPTKALTRVAEKE
ncbi:hypothetical protein Hanom_Chr00s104766g01805431 [Helianthus anomalus]